VELNELAHIEGLRQGSQASFEVIYKQYFNALYRYSFSILNDPHLAEEMVQNVFLKIWEKKGELVVQSSLKAYLYRAVHNASMNRIKHEKVKQQYESHTTHAMKTVKSQNPAQLSQYKQLQVALQSALEELPEQCRTVFQLSRFDELKYREIAVELNISEKTVENHMSKALKLLRLKLADFLISIVALIIHFKNSIL
jgi:RNA polymerase sigma-70 factor (ECF subfamily)